MVFDVVEGPSTSPSVTGYPTAGSTEGPGVSGTTTSQSEYTSPTGQPSSTGYPSEKPGFPTIQPSGLPTAPPSGFPTSSPSGFSTQPPSGPSTIPPAGFTTTTSAPQSEGQPSTSPPQTNEEPITSGPISTEGAPLTNPPGTTPSSQTYNPEHFTSAEATTSEKPAEVPADETTEATSKPSPGENEVVPTARDSGEVETEVNEDLNHPPHIHKIDVQCAKDMMTINIEFNRQFDGVIYSKGFYNMPECRYVNEKSGQKEYSINLKLDTCGTKFINAFDTEGQSYLENVLVLQNEPGIQEVWDTVRAVRCLWEGNLKETLSVALSVGMLTQEIVTFSGDTAMAKLDVQLGRGPFGEPADGLVKIGEPMTLVVSVTGDPGFDLQVKDCRATDSTGENVVPLTDNDGCVLKPKLFGAFQKTRSTGDTGASIIAYAYFNAFKFPDVMDLMIECNIELCKTDCEMCPNPDQKLEPGRRRRRRDLYTYNQTLADGITMGKHLRIILPEDLTDGDTIVNLSQTQGVCMSTQSFVFSSALLISILTFSCLFSAYMWLKNQRLNIKM